MLDWAVFFVAIIDILFAALSYLFWTSNICGNVIYNLPVNSIVGDIVRIAISAELLASFPLVASAGFQTLETGFELERIRAWPYTTVIITSPYFSRNMFYYIFRGAVIALLAAFASSVENYGLLVSLIGSLTIAATGFIFPQILYLKIFGREMKMWDKIPQYAIICFGVGMTLLGTFQSLQEIFFAVTHHGGPGTSKCNNS